MTFNIFYSYFIHFFIFTIIFCIYLNIIHHTTIQNIHYISETDYFGNESINDSCSLKKPFIFKYNSNLDYDSFLNLKFLKLKLYNDSQNYNIPSKKLINFIKNSNIDKPYLTYNNFINIENSDFVNNIHINCLNNAFKPIFNTYSRYDIITGTNNFFTPFLSHNNNSCFYVLISGSIKIALTDYNSFNNMNINDKDIWNYKNNNLIYCKMKSNHVIFIPPYVFNSVKFLSNDVIILALYYDSFSSTISNIYNKITSQISLLKN